MQKCVKFRSKSTACRRYVRPIGLSLDSGFFSRRNFNEHRGRKNAFGLLAFHILFLLSMLSTFRAISAELQSQVLQLFLRTLYL